MAKKVIKKMQDGGPVSTPTKKTNPYRDALGERGKGTMDGPIPGPKGKGIKPPKSTNDSITKKPSKPAPAGMERYMEKGDNGKVYKKGGSVKKK